MEAYDVAVVGAGVVGAAIARELARYQLSCVLVEAGPDVGAGASKASAALLHTGFDARPGTLEARLVRRGYELLRAFAPEAGIAVEVTGALVVAWTPEQREALPGILQRARAGGVRGVRELRAEELYAREPHLGPGALGGLEVPGEGIACPFSIPLALATQAVQNGVALRLSSPVRNVRQLGDAHELVVPSGSVRARWVVNAAGLLADELDRRFGHEGFTVTPRRGELVVFDKLARPLLRHILLPVPTDRSKGVLVAPTVFGNVLLGPTDQNLRDKRDTSTTAAGIGYLLERGRQVLPPLLQEEVTAIYAGLHAATEHADYQITVYPEQRYACVGGICSTGLTACMAIAEHVAGLLGEAGLPLVPKPELVPVRVPYLGEAGERPYRSAAAIARNPDYGRIVCHCEQVTRGEILDALASPIPPRDLDGLRRRTRVLMGRCQGSYCLAAVTALLAEATGQSAAELLGLAGRGGLPALHPLPAPPAATPRRPLDLTTHLRRQG